MPRETQEDLSLERVHGLGALLALGVRHGDREGRAGNDSETRRDETRAAAAEDEEEEAKSSRESRRRACKVVCELTTALRLGR